MLLWMFVCRSFVELHFPFFVSKSLAVEWFILNFMRNCWFIKGSGHLTFSLTVADSKVAPWSLSPGIYASVWPLPLRVGGMCDLLLPNREWQRWWDGRDCVTSQAASSPQAAGNVTPGSGTHEELNVLHCQQAGELGYRSCPAQASCETTDPVGILIGTLQRTQPSHTWASVPLKRWDVDTCHCQLPRLWSYCCAAVGNSYKQCTEVPVALHFHQHFILSVFFNFSHVNRSEMFAPCGFNLHD